jgi:hypothetical protein
MCAVHASKTTGSKGNVILQDVGSKVRSQIVASRNPPAPSLLLQKELAPFPALWHFLLSQMLPDPLFVEG